MGGKLGVRYGVQTIDDLRDRSVVAPNGCWKRPATMKQREQRGDDPSVWISALQQALSLGGAAYYLTRGRRLRKGFGFVRTCGTWGCANPEHRKVLSFANIARMNARPCSLDRKVKVAMARRKSSRISDADVAAIVASRETAAEIAERYGISKSYVYMLRRGGCRGAVVINAASVFTWKQAA